jgi:hypothetical protein
MSTVRDLTNQVFGRITVLQCVGRDKYKRAVWLCRCSCDGKEVEVQGYNLTTGDKKSCGCLRREMSAARLTGRHGKDHPGFKHGHSTHSRISHTYSSWANMVARCTNPQAAGHEHYVDAGVKVCERWRTFENFLADMDERPEGKTLGRFGDVGNYEPDNCAWQTPKQQGAENRIKHQLAFLTA